jgi:parallel beta-helix repeat protein
VGGYIDIVQIDGVRNMTLEDNYIHDPAVNSDHNDGIQSTASDGLKIQRNIFTARGVAGPDQGIILGHADPGDPYGYRKVTNTEVVNNLVHHWRGLGIVLGGTDATSVVNNTAYHNGDGTWAGFTMSAKNNPSVYQNVGAKLANNIFNRMSVGSRSVRPTIETHNLVRSGGSGTSLLTGDPLFSAGYRLKFTSPAINTANPRYAPTIDREKMPRDRRPDRGAYEYR